MVFPEQQAPKDWCRLYVLFAPQSPKAIILRRGPSKWTQQIAWDTDNDTFTYGQWVRGSVKNDLCDISPSGNYLIYFVQKYHLKDQDYETFTAISKAPTFTALTLWPLGDSWAGGGIFIDENSLWLNHPAEKRFPHPAHENKLFTLVPYPQDYLQAGELPERYRMLREGWKLLQATEQDPEFRKTRTLKPQIPRPPLDDHAGFLHYMKEIRKRWKERENLEIYKKAEIWERQAPQAPYTLVYKQTGYAWSSAKYGDPFLREYYLKSTASGVEELLPDVTYANFDHRGRLVMARYGSLLMCDFQEPLRAHPLVDLNGQKPPQKQPRKVNIS